MYGYISRLESFMDAVKVIPDGKVPVGDSLPATSTGTTSKSASGIVSPTEYAEISDTCKLSLNDVVYSSCADVDTLNPLTAPALMVMVTVALCNRPARVSPLTSASYSLTTIVWVPAFGNVADKVEIEAVPAPFVKTSTDPVRVNVSHVTRILLFGAYPSPVECLSPVPRTLFVQSKTFTANESN